MVFPLALLLAIQIAPPSPAVRLMQPQIASAGDRIGIAMGAGNDLYYTWSTDDGEKFAKPVKIPTGGKLSLGRHRGPRVVFQAGHVVISAVAGAKGGGADGDLLAWRSEDNGVTWQKPVRINDVPGSAREGLHAMSNGNGWIVAVWLDLRDKGTRLYGSRSDDGGVTWTKNFLVYESPGGTICQCCHPTVKIGPAGEIHVMWRNALDGSRDMYYTKSTDAGATWSAASKLGRDTWKLDACPMDGGALAVSATGKVFTVWRREQTVFVSLVDNKESSLGQGKDASIAAGLNDDLYAVWTAADGIHMRSSKDDVEKLLSPKGAYPQVVFTGRRVLAFWEQDGGIAMGVVESLDLPRPTIHKLQGPRSLNPKPPK
ncbi:MAG: sialidase family protein [Bryobacteraceae bacterium]